MLEGRAAFRCTTPDYLPLVGPLCDADAFAEAYAVLGRDARQVPDVPAPWLDGLYVNSGHGSRGLITAPLAGELLAAWLEGEPLPVPRDVAEACHPNRFPCAAWCAGAAACRSARRQRAAADNPASRSYTPRYKTQGVPTMPITLHPRPARAVAP